MSTPKSFKKSKTNTNTLKNEENTREPLLHNDTNNNNNNNSHNTTNNNHNINQNNDNHDIKEEEVLNNINNNTVNNNNDNHMDDNNNINNMNINNDNDNDKKNKKTIKSTNNCIDFLTSYGTQRVSILGDLSIKKKPIIITYHDIGLNDSLCFENFIKMLINYDGIFNYFNFININAPNHHLSDNNNNRNYNNDAIDAYDLLELSTEIETIRKQLNITQFIAIGIGAGCNILTYYAINYSFHLRGLILINPIGSIATYKEWLADSLFSMFGNQSQFLSDSLINSFMARYFPMGVSKERSNEFYDMFENMDKDSVIKYFRGFTRRKEFSLSMLHKIQCRCLIIAGEYSKVLSETINFQKLLPRHLCDFVILDKTGFLLTESHPSKLMPSIKLFIEACGFSLLSLEAKKYGKSVEMVDL